MTALTTFALITAIISAVALVITWLWSAYHMEAIGMRLQTELACTALMATMALRFSQNKAPSFLLWVMVIASAVFMAISIVRHSKRLLPKRGLWCRKRQRKTH